MKRSTIVFYCDQPRRYWIPAMLAAAKAERKTENGVEYLVVPVVAIREQVITPQNGVATLIPGSIISAATPAWNQQPLTINHPPADLDFSEQLDWIQQNAVGDVRFAHFDVEKKHLNVEAWIEVSAKTTDLVERIEAGEKINVSIGALAQTKSIEGQFAGRQYVGVMETMFPNHLALLPNDVGACSLDDGCGLPIAASKGTARPEQFNAGARIAAFIAKILNDRTSDDESRATLRKKMMVAAGIETTRFKKLESGEIDMVSDSEAIAIANAAGIDPWIFRFAVERDIQKFVENSGGDAMMAKQFRNEASKLQSMFASAMKFLTGAKDMKKELIQKIAAKRGWTVDEATTLLNAHSECDLKKLFASELDEKPVAGDPPADKDEKAETKPAATPPPATSEADKPVTHADLEKLAATINAGVVQAIESHTSRDERSKLILRCKQGGVNMTDEDFGKLTLGQLQAIAAPLPEPTYFGAAGAAQDGKPGGFADFVMAEAGDSVADWMKQ